jgi:hypothetical protein
MSSDTSNRQPTGSPAPPVSDRTAIYALAGVIGAATIAFIGTEWTARSAFDAQMVQIGVAILSADPGKSDVAPARDWAIKMVEKHSGAPFSETDRQTLLHHPIQPPAFPAIPGFAYGGATCSSFVRSPDGSWRVPRMQDGNPSGEFDTFPSGSSPAMLLEQRCGRK